MFLKYNTESMNHERKKDDKIDFIKIKNFILQKIMFKDWNDKAQVGEYIKHIF